MRSLATVAAGLAIAGGIYLSAPAYSMELSIIPDSGGKTGILEGTIDEESGLVARRFILDHKKLDTLIISSPGGEISNAEVVAEAIHNAHLKTVVYDTCASSCFVLFVAGTEKVAIESALIGIHSAAKTDGETNAMTEKATDGMNKVLLMYGVPQSLVDILKATKQPDIHWLTADEEKSAGIKIMAE